jgi:sulfur-oxidizing protein SoxZ
MAAPMKIKARMQGDTAEIRVLVNHPMENGQRKDAAGNLIPAHFIRRLTISLGERVVVDSTFGTAVSRNPLFAFKLTGARPGVRVIVSWKDNRGESRTDETVIA